MKNRYPYLAYWRECGFDKFPTIPPYVILGKNRKAFQEYLKKNRGVHSRFVSSEAEIVEMNMHAIDEEAAIRLHSIMDNAIYEMGTFCLDLQIRFMREGLSREDAKKEWANKFLPTTRGGAGLPLQNQKLIIKQIYSELMECIREIRRELDLPLSGKSGNTWPVQVALEDMEYISDIYIIFKKEELPLLTEQPSLRKTSLKIIKTRLRRSVLYPITERTLEDIIDKTSL